MLPSAVGASAAFVAPAAAAIPSALSRVRKTVSARNHSHPRSLFYFVAAAVIAYSVRMMGGALWRVHPEPRRATTMHGPAVLAGAMP